jgi:acetylornithine deacetylase/succinyl-diaminopimelate desuccinylase-like protein
LLWFRSTSRARHACVVPTPAADVDAFVLGAIQKFLVRTAPYFTDASALTPALGNPPTIILGPGEAAKAHQTDEYCSVERIRDATDMYSRLAARWSRTSDPAGFVPFKTLSA